MYKRILVFDSGYYMHRAIFAFQNKLSKIDEFLEKAPITYIRMILGDLNKVNFNSETDMVILAADYLKSWRYDYDPLYKHRRKKKRETKENEDWWTVIYNDFDIFLTLLNNYTPFFQIKLPRIEADDIAGVISKNYPDKEIIHFTVDSDWQQLCIYNNTKIFSPKSKKFKEVKSPILILQNKINKGDKSDDIETKPKTEEERKIREKIVNLINLPLEIEELIKKELNELYFKPLKISKLPIPNRVKKTFMKLYKII